MATKDITFRSDFSGNATLATGLHYYLGIINMLFNMVPGTDPYNPEMGLDVAKLRFTAGVQNHRNTEYESNIANQFNKYTDLNISSVIVQFIDDQWKITFTVTTNSATYNAFVGYRDDTLDVLLQ